MTSLLLVNMGNVLRHVKTANSETAISCYNESLRISKLRFGANHERVASVMFSLGKLHDASHDFSRAIHYYQSALSVYKQKYSQDLRRRLCSGGPSELGFFGNDG